MNSIRALDKREYLMIIWVNFSYFSVKPYVVTPFLKLSQRDGSDEVSQHMFLTRINKNYPLSPNTLSYLELRIWMLERITIIVLRFRLFNAENA